MNASSLQGGAFGMRISSINKVRSDICLYINKITHSGNSW
jgi:hypothetical protein